MGVRGLSKWLKSSYPAAFSLRPSRYAPSPLTGPSPQLNDCSAIFDEVYVDLNPLLHCVARTETSERGIFRRTASLLRTLLRTLVPAERLVLTLDGPASLSKLAEQRRRRLEHSVRCARNGSFDCQQFSPGCLFMTRFEEHLCQLFLDSDRLRMRAKTQVRISGAAVPGEGELKIFEEIRKSHHSRMQGSPRRAIIATDSDILLQTIGHGIPHSHVITPPWQQRTSSDHFQLDRLLQELQRLPDHRNARLNLVFLATLSSNDYLSGLRFANYTSLWPFFVSTRHTLVDENHQISISGLRDFAHDYCRNGLPSHLVGPQERQLEEARQNPEGSHDRVLRYLTSISALFGQITGTGPALTNHGCEDSQLAPSIGEIAVMDVERVARDLSTVAATDTPSTSNGKGAAPLLHPGAAAILMMDLHEEALKHLPAALLPIAREYVQRQASFSSERAAIDWLHLRIEAIPRETLPATDLKTIFRRSDVLVRLEAPVVRGSRAGRLGALYP